MLTSVHFLFHGICNLSVQWRFGTRTFPKCFPESFLRVASEEFNNYCVCGKSLPVRIASRRTRLMLQLAWGSCAPQQGRVIHDWNARGIVRRQCLLDPSGQDTRAVPGSQRPPPLSDFLRPLLSGWHPELQPKQDRGRGDRESPGRWGLTIGAPRRRVRPHPSGQNLSKAGHLPGAPQLRTQRKV